MKDEMTDGLKVRGSFRLRIVEDGPSGEPIVKSTSDWYENQIVNLGFNQYAVSALGAIAGSKQITHVALGTGTEPGAADTSLQNELDSAGSRAAVTAATTTGSKTLNLVATFASSQSFASATVSLKNIGLFNTSTVTTGTLFAGNTYATSTCATNQSVNVTYQIVFS